MKLKSQHIKKKKSKPFDSQKHIKHRHKTRPSIRPITMQVSKNIRSHPMTMTFNSIFTQLNHPNNKNNTRLFPNSPISVQNDILHSSKLSIHTSQFSNPYSLGKSHPLNQHKQQQQHQQQPSFIKQSKISPISQSFHTNNTMNGPSHQHIQEQGEDDEYTLDDILNTVHNIGAPDRAGGDLYVYFDGDDIFTLFQRGPSVGGHAPESTPPADNQGRILPINYDTVHYHNPYDMFKFETSTPFDPGIDPINPHLPLQDQLDPYIEESLAFPGAVIQYRSTITDPVELHAYDETFVREACPRYYEEFIHKHDPTLPYEKRWPLALERVSEGTSFFYQPPENWSDFFFRDIYYGPREARWGAIVGFTTWITCAGFMTAEGIGAMEQYFYDLDHSHNY